MDIEYFHNRLKSLYQTTEDKYNKQINLTENNKERIRSLKNKYKGNRCFIIGGSPSLSLLDLSKLNNEYTFTVNRGYMLREINFLHTTFHVISDCRTFIDDGARAELLENFCDYLFCYGGMKTPIMCNNTYYFDCVFPEFMQHTIFQRNLELPLIAYRSVIHYAIQIAYYLGFVDIYLIGVDIDFTYNAGHFYEETQGEKERQVSITQAEAPKIIEGLKNCREWLIKNERNLYNASPVGNVNCMPRVNYDDLFIK